MHLLRALLIAPSDSLPVLRYQSRAYCSDSSLAPRRGFLAVKSKVWVCLSVVQGVLSLSLQDFDRQLRKFCINASLLWLKRVLAQSVLFRNVF